MSSKKVYSKPGLFGKTILYNDKGQVIGSGTPISSKTTVYTDVPIVKSLTLSNCLSRCGNCQSSSSAQSKEFFHVLNL